MKYTFNNLTELPNSGTAIYFAYQDNDGLVLLDEQAAIANEATDGQIARAIKVAKFKADSATTLNIIAPNKTKLDAIIIAGLGKIDEANEENLMDTGANAFGAAQIISDEVSFVIGHEVIAADSVLLGATLRAYKWDKYQTVKKVTTGRASAIGVYSA
ncbi:MAG: hypothetical protein HRU28_14690, partial [Rhizobiales bacterium]|nr:hypothetical protein [Hyphomicrobiales bacterium]